MSTVEIYQAKELACKAHPGQITDNSSPAHITHGGILGGPFPQTGFGVPMFGSCWGSHALVPLHEAPHSPDKQLQHLTCVTSHHRRAHHVIVQLLRWSRAS